LTIFGMENKHDFHDLPSGASEPEAPVADSDSSPEPVKDKASPAPHKNKKRSNLRWYGAIFLLALILCWVAARYARTYFLGLWDDIHVVNFCVNITPTVLSILFAFVVDKDLKGRMRWRWLFRILVVTLGLGLSGLLWHQQILADKQSDELMKGAVNSAIEKSNKHADEQFQKVQADVGGVQRQVEGDLPPQNSASQNWSSLVI